MTKILLSIETTCDIPLEELNKLNVNHISLSYRNETTGEENPNLTLKEFYDEIRNGALFKTSLINEYEFEEYFKELLKEGHTLDCIKVMKHCLGYNAIENLVLDTIARCHKRYHNSNSIKHLQSYVNQLNKVIEPLKIIIFNDYKDALVYKSKDKDPSLIKIFNDGI